MADGYDGVFTRRDALATLGIGGVAIATGCAGATRATTLTAHSEPISGDQTMAITASLAGNHSAVPLPFRAGLLNGLSERMISSHHENNYGGAVRNLNLVEQELSQITADTPPFVVTALRERELTFRNSKTLHEAYFANLGGNGQRSGSIEAAIAGAYGTAARWEQHMVATGMGLGGGSGWALLCFELDAGSLRTISSGNHTQTLSTSVPLLVMDMYEHSYQMDFGAGVKGYIEAFFANVNWDEVNRRLEVAQRMRAISAGSTG